MRPLEATSLVSGGSRLLSLRLGPGESLTKRLLEELDSAGAGGAAVVSAVGSLRSVDYAVVDLEGSRVRFDRRRVEGAIELGALGGHLGREADGTPGFHLHGLFALGSGEVVGGHVFEAVVLLTLEMTLALADGAGWRIQPYPDTGGYELDLPGRIFVPEER